MSQAKQVVPAMDGWFTTDEKAPCLLGTRRVQCGTYYFPKEASFCRNPGCSSTELAEVALSRRGTVWSYTNNCYPPPPPYISPTTDFTSFAVAAVELAEEKMVVLGMVAPPLNCSDLTVGMEMEVVLDTLYEDDAHRYLTWKWRPVAG